MAKAAPRMAAKASRHAPRRLTRLRRRLVCGPVISKGRCWCLMPRPCCALALDADAAQVAKNNHAVVKRVPSGGGQHSDFLAGAVDCVRVQGGHAGLLGRKKARRAVAGRAGWCVYGCAAGQRGKSLFAAVLSAFADHGAEAWRWSPGAFPRPGPAAIGQLLGALLLLLSDLVMARLRLAAGCGSCSLWGYYRLFRTLRGQVRSTIKSTAG